MRITILSKVWEHHTASGGYDRLASAVGAKIIRRNRSVGITSRIAKKLWYRWTTSGSYMKHYEFGDWLAEQRLLIKCLFYPPDVVHVFYGDEQLDLLLRWRKFLRCALVVTFHIPASWSLKRFEYFQS